MKLKVKIHHKTYNEEVKKGPQTQKHQEYQLLEVQSREIFMRGEFQASVGHR